MILICRQIYEFFATKPYYFSEKNKNDRLLSNIFYEMLSLFHFFFVSLPQ